ncbi:MAG: efflux transporter outer membrane subunit [Nitrospirae bacterium]|nr:MAG: efflux transporter outer membrane subunit [Nitrospirota bacterium]
MKRLFAIAVVVLFSACTPIKRQELNVSVPERFQNSSGHPTREVSFTEWWKEFHDEKLNQLIEDTLKYNHDIKAAAERVLQARALLGVSRSQRFPSLNLNLSTSRQRQTTMGITTHTNTFNINLMASYEADLWGRFSSEQKRALASLEALRQQKRVIIQSVIADVVNLYLHANTLKEMIKIRYDYIKNAEKNLQIIKQRYALGRASYLDVLQAESTLNDALSQIEPLRRQLKDTLYRLSILTGKYPEELPISGVGPSVYVETLRPVPEGLPSDLLRRRPDILATALKAEEAFQALKVARAKRFPSITLTATGGYASSELKDLFKPDSLFWQLSAGILQPLFDAGRLKAQEEAQRARYREALANYAKTVLQAFYEVEKALADRKSLYKERAEVLELVKNLKKTYQSALDRYTLGVSDLTTVLNLQRQLFSARIRLVLTEESIIANRVFLYRAFGGHWIEEKNLNKEGA